MDVNETLRVIRDAVADADRAAPGSPEEFAAGSMVADLFRVLDEWLSNGGCLPVDWDTKGKLVLGQEV